MSQSATATIPFHLPAIEPLTACFDGPQLTSDGGLVWLAEADTQLDLTARLAAVIPDKRRSSVQHPLIELLRQRLFQIACGYEDQDDADTADVTRSSNEPVAAWPKTSPWPANLPSPASRMPSMGTPAAGWRMPCWPCIWTSAGGTVDRRVS